ncbi:hypothetical protein [Flavobacterium sp. 9AF]|uniref:hypothetical protein n=1 Tax=Flavobacterium sp. 9AF TaxID=2653142 RepID=UPI001359117D|nr:hypothetical protein [Flavobacterium sp. 9AF]
MKIKALYIFLFVLLFSCKPDDTIIEENRKFYMGVTPWPANFTSQDLEKAYDFINTKCDIVSHHFDEGIPYEEAYHNLEMPVALQQEINSRLSKTNSNLKVLLSVAALNLTRKEKADYYRNSTVESSIKASWNNKTFSNPEIITAYTNYLEYLINNFQPDYINFGVESNNPEFIATDFTEYKIFLAQVYQNLKSNHPNIPCFISYMVSESNGGFVNATELLPYTDIIGLSAYPYISISSSINGNTNPDLFPANYFEKYIFMANKPFCFAETSYIAENLVISSYNLNKQGTTIWQDNYLKTILNLSQNKNAVFLIWFCSKDYDDGNLFLQQQGLYTDLFGLWQDTGLIDENNNKRLSYYTWENWFKKEKTE